MIRKFFSFLHTYEASGQYWRGITKAGLVRAHTGVRLVNTPWGADEARFFQLDMFITLAGIRPFG